MENFLEMKSEVRILIQKNYEHEHPFKLLYLFTILKQAYFHSYKFNPKYFTNYVPIPGNLLLYFNKYCSYTLY